jgi:hypothetical protein
MTWVLLVTVAVALVAVAFFAFRREEADPPSAIVPHFDRDPENDKVVVVKGWSDDEVQQIIGDFIGTSEDDGYPPYSIKPQMQGGNICRLTFPNDIHPWLFRDLVNYLVYPLDIDFENRAITVYGKITLSSAFRGVDASLWGEKVILYVPENDEDYDVIYLQTASGANFSYSFTGPEWKRVGDARLSEEVASLLSVP